jgi:hypothetical protein
LKNNPNEHIKPIRPHNYNIPTKLCEKCDVEFVAAHPANWIKHIKSKKHQNNEPDKFRIVCEICNIEVARVHWSIHLKSKGHMKNDPDQTIRPLKEINLDINNGI